MWVRLSHKISDSGGTHGALTNSRDARADDGAAARLVVLAAAAGAEVVASDAGVLTHGLGLGQPFVVLGEHVAGFSQ